jgi:hypothetical protein
VIVPMNHLSLRAITPIPELCAVSLASFNRRSENIRASPAGRRLLRRTNPWTSFGTHASSRQHSSGEAPQLFDEFRVTGARRFDQDLESVAFGGEKLVTEIGRRWPLGRPCDVRGLARLVFRMYRDGAKPVIGANRVPLRLKIRRGIVAQRRAPPREPGTANRPTCYEGQISLFPTNHSQGIINMCDRAEPRSKSAL